MHHEYLEDPSDRKHARIHGGWFSRSVLVACVGVRRSSPCDTVDGGDDANDFNSWWIVRYHWVSEFTPRKYEKVLSYLFG